MQFTETGKTVYERTYSRTKPDGSHETWPETVERVVDGNLGLNSQHLLPDEGIRLQDMIEQFAMIPAGRHLWASGVKGRQYLFNCWVAPWDRDDVTRHFSFTFLRLMEGGGVGSNYSNEYLNAYPEINGPHDVHIVCDPEHPDYEKMKDAGVLSNSYDHEWAGSFEVEDSREGWADALTDLLSTYYREAENANRVFDVSRVRGEGARLKTFGGRASGPLPLARMLIEVSDVLNDASGDFLQGLDAMAIDHAIAKCVVSGGNRRSARMAIMRWDDYQVEDFIRIKSLTGEHWTTNISVEVDDEFWDAVARGNDIANELLELITENMLVNGEPGIWNSSLSNEGEPNRVSATNPCGEIALEEGENCNLGHINLAAFVNDDGTVDEDGMAVAHRLMTRFLIRATFGDVNDERTRELLARNRRIGVGHLGVASFLAMMGVRYSDAPQTGWFTSLLRRMAEVVEDEARRYAHDLRIPVPVKTRTVAPTGTIAKMPGVSEGIHPIFAKYFLRRIRFSDVDPDQRATVGDYAARGYKVEPDLYAEETSVVEIPTKDILMADVEMRFGEEEAKAIVQGADDLSLADMLAFQRMYQSNWADNAVSYTVNLDASHYTPRQVANALLRESPGLKGATIFPETSMPQAPYERLTEVDFEFHERLREVTVADGVDPDCASGACPVR